jgi:hypothetical protein
VSVEIIRPVKPTATDRCIGNCNGDQMQENSVPPVKPTLWTLSVGAISDLLW